MQVEVSGRLTLLQGIMPIQRVSSSNEAPSYLLCAKPKSPLQDYGFSIRLLMRLVEKAGASAGCTHDSRFFAFRATSLMLLGRGGISSLENGCEMRFLTRPRLFTIVEAVALRLTA